MPLSDGAGEVVEVGPGATRFAVGARVAGIFMQTWLEGALTEAKGKSALGGAIDGVLAEQVVLHEDGLVAVPDHLSFEEAATLPCAAVTAWNALIEGGVQAGETVLTLGTGGVSLFALQFARWPGRGDRHLQQRREAGAGEAARRRRTAINYKTTPEWDKKVRDLTGGVGVDHVVEVGGAGTLPRSLKAVRTGGHVALIGVLSGGGEVQSDAGADEGGALAGRLRRLAGDVRGDEPGDRAAPDAAGDRRVFPFEEARAAYRHMESGAHFGKIVLRL